MIKNIIFDMGNVLARFDAARFCASHVKNEKDAALLCREVFSSIEWARLDRGVIGADEAAASIQERLPAQLHEDVRWLIDHWYDHFEPDPKMEKLAGGLKNKGLGLYLLSNAGFDFYNFRDSLGALRFFDGQLISAEVHLLKPDRQIFETLLRRFSLVAEECFFVDDMSINVEAALNIGFSGMVYRGSAEELAAALKNRIGEFAF